MRFGSADGREGFRGAIGNSATRRKEHQGQQDFTFHQQAQGLFSRVAIQLASISS
jgi:hypothetical protein